MYIPKPIDTSDVKLSEELLALTEKLAANTHDVWSVGRINQGWSYGSVRDDLKKENPCLVPYDELPESEKDYDRNTAIETLKLIIKLGYNITQGSSLRNSEDILWGVCKNSEENEGSEQAEVDVDFDSEKFLAEINALFGDDSEDRELDDIDDEFDNTIVLDDEDGKQHQFEFLDLIEYEGNEYVILMPAFTPTENEEDDYNSEEVVILRFEENDSGDLESYESVDDERILKAVFNIFKAKFEDEFDFSEFEDD